MKGRRKAKRPSPAHRPQEGHPIVFGNIGAFDDPAQEPGGLSRSEKLVKAGRGPCGY
jgi:hypothetical protein